MAQVKVWNDNVHPFEQLFKGEKIRIEPKECIVMEYEEAIDFKGAFSPMPPADFAGDHSLYYKMIRVEEPPPGAIYKDEGLVNHATGKRAASAEELAETLAQFRHLLIKDPEADKASGSEIAALKAELEDLKALVKGGVTIKKGPGRPRKEASA